MRFEDMSRAELAQKLAESVLRTRDEILRYLEEARAIGKRKEARSWEANLRKTDKLIAEYGLERYALKPWR